MTPKGILAYAAGLVTLFLGVGLGSLALLYATVAPRPGGESALGLLCSAVFIFTAAGLISGGLYRMLNHLYRAISRTDPATDRPLRGRSIFLLGLLGGAMAVPTTIVFLLMPGVNPGH